MYAMKLYKKWQIRKEGPECKIKQCVANGFFIFL